MRRLLTSLVVLLPIGATLPAAAEEWEFSVVPYVWMAGLSGDLATLPNLPEAEVDLSFIDVLENLDIAAFAVAEARRGEIFFRGEASYARLSKSASTPGPLFSGADLTSETMTGALTAGRTIKRGSDYRFEGFAGVRIWSVDTDLRFEQGILPDRSTSESETFVDPIIGLSGNYRVAPRWTVAGSGSIGGFGVGADFEYGLTGVASWEAGENWSMMFGYRYLAVDYSNDGFVFDVAQHGPLVGVRFDF